MDTDASQIRSDVLASANNVGSQLDKIKERLDSISPAALDECCDMLRPDEAAKLRVSLAYTLLSLYSVGMNTSGNAEAGSDIGNEMQRVKAAVVRLNKAAEAPKLQLDKKAAKRMISHAL
ncbi:hypothetical protein B484DRAFT_454482 [Ochromonadaceae sp. CCMP2298]|nr:hypothetical protein B484DRAFT_454482 [Ochromonadaceae sp. CCMP2298]|mmetsp:Transcript_4324/g.9694  ORF Transcript_4324/g.9694 Transcript_4324/m.9694 type:complete len:120 (-) Transcript_4324:1462-1821(-)